MLTPEHRKAAELRENYLAEIGEQLRLRLQPIETYESIEELRDHLNAMALAHEELGLDVETAMRAAIQRFGQANELGGKLADAVPRRLHRPKTGIQKPPRSLFLMIAVGAILSFGLTEVIGWPLSNLPHMEILPLQTAALLSVFSALTSSTLALRLRAWRPLPLALLAATLHNLALAPLLINTNWAVHLASAATLSALALSLGISAIVQPRVSRPEPQLGVLT